MLSKINQSHRRPNTAWFYLYEASKVVKFIESESRVVVPRGYEVLGKGSSCLVAIEFQIFKIQMFWRSD